MKQRMAPIQSSKEKPPNKFLLNLTHSGVRFGGVRALGPSLKRISWACSGVKPCDPSVNRIKIKR